METLGEDVCSRTMLLLAVSFGLRISEVLGSKWKDVDWLAKTIRIERGVEIFVFCRQHANCRCTARNP
jgi:integrase